MTTHPTRRAWVAAAVSAPFAVVLVLHVSHYLSFLSDDALISLRYAQRLLEGHGLTWSAGRPVEGYSNLLWILLVAGLGAFGADLVDASRILGVVGMASILFAIARWYTGRYTIRAAWFPAAMSLSFVSLAAPIAVWAIGGLEQPLCGALLAFSIPLAFTILESSEPARATLLGLSMVLGLLCLSRPDGPIFAVSAAAAIAAEAWLSGKRRPLSNAVLVLCLPALFTAGQIAFRLYYYGELVPNTALVKVVLSSVRIEGGVRYLTGGLRALLPLSAIALTSLVGLSILARSRAKGLYLMAMAVPWAAYLVFVGGDIFPAYRHFVPLIVILAFTLAEGALIVVDALAARPLYLCTVAAIGLALSVPYTRGQLSDRQIQRAARERWEWDGKALGQLLKAAFSRQQPLVAVTAAGAIPFWSELPSLDMLGLNDYYLPRHPPADLGKGMIGHELGDGRYVLDQRPDIIVFSIGSGPSYRSGDQMAKTVEFHERYVPVTIGIPSRGYSGIVYIFRYSDRIGIARDGDSLRIPGYLFTGEGAAASLDEANRLVVRVADGRSVQLTFTLDSAARWTAEVGKPGQPAIAVDVRQDGSSISVTLRAAAGAGPVDVDEVTLRSVGR